MEKSRRILKILVITLIIIAIGLMWIIKKNVDKMNENRYDEIFGQSEESVPQKVSELDFSLNLTSPIDFESFEGNEFPLIIDFGADWCEPCRKMKPDFEKVNIKMQGKAFIKYGDTEKYPEVTGDIPVSVIPTQCFFNADGTPFVPSKELSEKLDFSMYSRKSAQKHIYTIHQGVLTEAELYMILEEMGVDTK